MSHEIRTKAGNRVWGLLLSDREDEIEEADIIAIEREACPDDGGWAAQHREARAALDRILLPSDLERVEG